MAYMITSDCICCQACEWECPNLAISERISQYVIDPARCTECIRDSGSPRCADICPVNACQPDPDNHETLEQLLIKSRKLSPGKRTAHAGA